MKKTKIEWADSTWNPVTGCLHDCPYCYARGIAKRFGGCQASPDGRTEKKEIWLTERLTKMSAEGMKMTAAYPYGFTPTFHEYRLDDLNGADFGSTIFVCSMADLFGDWISDKWIQRVFDACCNAPGHRYLFLTKNPKRYAILDDKGILPMDSNFWYGTTVDDPSRPYFVSDRCHTFISAEPVLKNLDLLANRVKLSGNRPAWIIMGAETGHRTGKVVPEKRWVENLVRIAEECRIPVFMKDSMRTVWGENIITQLPWGDRE